jgi:hypothetical protein
MKVKSKILDPDSLLTIISFYFYFNFPCPNLCVFSLCLFRKQRCLSAFANPFDDSEAETQDNDP